MASTQSAAAPARTGDAPTPLRFEVTVIPVADVDRAKACYAGLDWRLDADFPIDPTFRIVREIWRGRGVSNAGREAGPDPEHTTFAAFAGPDGNRWLLPEIHDRLPGRGIPLDAGPLAQLLEEAEQHHGAYEPVAPPHHWSDWYAPNIVARRDGSTPDEAATTYLADVKGIVVPPQS
jgi:hypothetical protein